MFGVFLDLCENVFFLIQCRGGSLSPAGQVFFAYHDCVQAKKMMKVPVDCQYFFWIVCSWWQQTKARLRFPSLLGKPTGASKLKFYPQPFTSQTPWQHQKPWMGCLSFPAFLPSAPAHTTQLWEPPKPPARSPVLVLPLVVDLLCCW